MRADDLCAPLPDGPGAGPDLGLGAEFETIARWREQEDTALGPGDGRGTPRQADWEAVQRETASLLRTRSKDLRLAGWWAEATAWREGLAGLADGMELMAALCERWWATLHPRPEAGDPEPRAAAMRWWLARSTRLVSTAPVLQVGRRTLGLADIERARRSAAAAAEGVDAMLMQAVHEAMRGTGAGGLSARVAALRRTLAALDRLQACSDAGLAQASPSFDGARDALERAADTLARLARDCGLAPQPVPPAAQQAGDASHLAPAGGEPQALRRPAAAAGHEIGPTGAPIGRDEAIAQLRRIAEFLRRTEPHNPAAYLADKAARWAGLALHAWLREVVADEQALSRLETTLGVARDTEPGH
ncbi:type VI secretion system protein TssA [Rubrivivax gelatinosus]|uniref:Type VI secretion system protein ImpA n=1 Tax=Rubrivivax gelatinosus TaxID=28068 RepID=A0A4R2MFQ1_RUBGE|nr:type VI secretion system protein TssA [Rubrivivax gelatinosus]MBK1685892.1 type VI secretion protein ImpA [Rubrivivax gelatinosus]TCP04085.1 type VI secretion system protein ImpA [Rubrivivax gelatinosus]